jgi:glycosyltransferase involved in cell wall biosynthesis
MENINIVILSPELYPCKIGGVEIFNHYLIKGLSKKGHEVWVFTTCNNDWDENNIHTVELNRRYLPRSNITVNLYILNKLNKMKKQIDIIYVPYTSNSHLAYPMLLAKNIFDVPYIISIHGGGMHPWKPKTPHRLFFKHADAIVAVSKTIKENYEKRSMRKITVIPPLLPFTESGIPKHEARKKYGFNDQDAIILSLGSIKKIKGSDILLDAFLNLDREFIEEHNLKLLFVGDGPLHSELQEKCDKIGFDQYVKFFGYVPREKIPEMYGLADIYVIPSLFEGTPITLLEAFFNGLPILGSNTTGINNLINHGVNGLLFAKENAQDLNAKLIEIVEDKDLAAKLGRFAKNDYLKNYNFENVVDEYITIMKDICGDKNE